MNIFQDVKKNEYGYYELINKPSEEELREYYSKKYYQENKGNYEKRYTTSEMENIFNKFQRRWKLIENHSFQKKRFLDIGCGEGWSLKYFYEKGWEIKGLDYSLAGIHHHNHELSENVTSGDIIDNIVQLSKNKKQYDLILLDNVLEHVIDPEELLNHVKEILAPNGILMIEVPNDFSALQLHLLREKKIDKPFWIAHPDHISYFNKDGLNKLCDAAGFYNIHMISDFPIDFNLFNYLTNYVEEKSLGKSVHSSRIELENFLNDVSAEKLNELYRLLADMGLGRNIFGVYSKL